MLTERKDAPTPAPITKAYVRRLWHEAGRNTSALGCSACPDRAICGGLQLRAAFMDCLQFCCGDPSGCDQVCRNNENYIDHVREIGGFNLNTVPRGPVLIAPALPTSAPIVFHGKRRVVPISMDAVALPLYAMFDRQTGMPRFSFGSKLRSQFMIAPETMILLTGTDKDPPLERWWGLGEPARRVIIRALLNAGVAMTTTPNYSLILNRPRWDDLHSMKRIGLVHYEFLDEGLPAALHVNGRTDIDFFRWTEFVAARRSIVS
jgi:hypothetical protein